MILPNAVRAAIFDMDGTLLDTERLYLRAISDACSAMRLEADDGFFLQMLGTPWSNCYALMERRFGGGFVRERFDGLFEDRFGALTRDGIPVKPGVRELLAHLQSRSTPMAVATSTNGEVARRQLERAGLLNYFAAQVTADMVKEAKPAPETFLKAAEELAVAPQYCLALEDSPAGVQSAVGSGAMTIMIPDLAPATAAERSLCVAVVRSMHDVLDCLIAAEAASSV
ncbi:MAG: HAD family phosphatase [Methylocystis silviterrae]|uniref:HAD family hydrolase n=1 Tax=Methylocystis silviterrae TaxID=2743612 RepID=UPI003C77D6E7